MELKVKKRNFSRELIRRAVADVEGGMSRWEACQKYGMSYNSMGSWLKQYASETYRSDGRLKITDHQKRIIISKIQAGILSYQEASRSHGVKMVTLKRWVRRSKASNVDLSGNESTVGASKSSVPEDLQRALNDANLKILALETLIDVAEQQFKINIRKKPGAKQ
jgi:transposase